MATFPTTKSRILDADYIYWSTISQSPTTGTTILDSGFRRTPGSQVTTSTGHPFRLLGKTPWDIGGGFSTYKVEWFPKGTQTAYNTANPTTAYRKHTGPIRAAFSDISTTPPSFMPPVISNAELIGAGTKGVAMATPNSPLIDLATFAGEMREMPKIYNPMKWKEALLNLRKLPRRTAEDYLNFEFGWRPLVNEIKDFHEKTQDADQRLRKFVRNSGRRVRRKRTVYSSQNTTVTKTEGTSVYPSPPLDPTYYSNPTAVGTRVLTLENKVTATFSGSFTYYLPPVHNQYERDKRRSRLRRYLTGAELSPDVLWNLAPWSWAVDWMSSMGAIMHNLTAFSQDGLVMNYGYLTYHQECKATYEYSGKNFKNGPSGPLIQICLASRTQRVRATPFGFGLNPGSFSTRQWAIIGALGITRMPQSLDN